ncbi:MAG: DUF5011 domain-containing protein [Erysipelothrix sp.]|nr:DUF5011 domain-containing protein [Erysipelothrix sp.]
MRKLITLGVFIALLYLMTVSLAASSLRLVNEVNYMKIDHKTSSLEVGGWAFIMDAQHYLNTASHEYLLILRSKSDSFTIKGVQTNISQTETMAYIGSRKCRVDEYKQTSYVCNHDYNNVGFKFNIPLSKLKENHDYVAAIQVKAKHANVTKEVPLYFANKESIKLSDKNMQYSIDSKLYNSKVKVLNSSVLARLEPKKTSPSYPSLKSCSNSKSSYFKNTTIFNNIFDKKLQGNNTYYQVRGKYGACVNKVSEVIEGNDLTSVWIASNFVEQLGEPLTIKSRRSNHEPSITISEHPTIYVNDTFNVRAGVTANDFEDGEITHKIRVESNNYQNLPGLYEIVFSVTDSNGNTARAIKYVRVLARNYPPVIIAHDVELQQFDPYNPLDYASALDQDKNDISSKITALKTIDMTKVGTFTQCYRVTDKYNLSDEKCSKVIINEVEKNFRFISKQKLFYNEAWPKIWKDKEDQLEAQIKNKIIYSQASLQK